ncbi:hypothetical protein DER46DRAFT_690196 [Fusarium sp. MPI-SDFR-AT-0072]|nr:hypothetical protein DER46DRAFT_690196 [Fusarium sp. MPI-SDFR-AT-0072]
MEDSDQTPRVKPSGQRPIILNPKFPISNAIFHLFPNLSMELRAMIWEQSLTCERYIKVELCTVDEITDKIRRGGIPGKVRPLTGQYRILFRHPPKPSALFSTSVESRASAQRCYRIVLPCFYVTKSPSIIDSLQISEQNAERNPQGIVLSHVPPYGPNIPKRPQALIPGTLSLNPELDALEIDGLPQFKNFANDVWNHDPRKAGLYHTAFLYTYWSFALGFHRLPRYDSSEEQLRQCAKSWPGFEVSHLYTTLMWTEYPTHVPLNTSAYCSIAVHFLSQGLPTTFQDSRIHDSSGTKYLIIFISIFPTPQTSDGHTKNG